VFIRGKKTQYSKHNYAYFGITGPKNNDGSPTKSSKYKYGKSKINATSKPGDTKTVLSIDELKHNIEQAFETFENSKKNKASASKLVNNVLSYTKTLIS